MSPQPLYHHPGNRQKTILLPLPASPPVHISFNDLWLTVPIGGICSKEKKDVLRGVSGTFKSGELSAIMGPSGAGKSTLLNVLTGFTKGNLRGEVKMDGKLISPGRGGVRALSCYIMQEDHLNPFFTTLEIMTMATHLKLGSALSDKSKQLLVEDILDSLGMGSTMYTKCGRLSGGQKKRLCIALELIDNPPIMYLDEPTTGLDSSSTTQLVRLLKSLAQGGRNIICTIHQPSATMFELFDHTYMVSNGLCLYQGSPRNLVSFLQTVGISCPQYHNPADFMLDVMSGEFGDFTEQLAIASKDPSWRTPPSLQESIMYKGKEAEDNNNKTKSSKAASEKTCVLVNSPSEFYRFFVLFRRNMVQLHRDWTMIYLKAVLHALVGLIVGLLFHDIGNDGGKAITNVSYMMTAIVYQSFTTFMPAVLKFPSEINTLKKEQFNNWYKLRTYYFAFISSDIPVQMLFSFIFITISYYLSGQILEWDKFMRFSLISQLTIFISECIGLALGTADNPVNGIFWGSVIFALLILHAGFLAILSHMPLPLYYFSFLNFMRYGLQSMAITMYGSGRPQLDCPESQNYCHFKYPEMILTEIGMMDVNYWLDTGILFGFCLFFFFNGYFFLYRKIKCH